MRGLAGELESRLTSPAVVSPAADATMRARWRALALTDPVARMVRNAVHAGIDGETYDLRQLALAAIDLVVASMGFARQVRLDDLLANVADLAGRMRPGREFHREWQAVARAVVKGLLNDAHDQHAFAYTYVDVSDPQRTRREEYAFKLLHLLDGPDGAVVLASNQAVMLFLNGLDVDVDDSEAALSVVLQRQLNDRRFEAATRTAAQAERMSLAMAASLAEVLDATRRDVRSCDWLDEVPRRLDRAREHVEARLREDAAVLDHVSSGIDAEGSPGVRRASGELVELLRRIRQVHLDLQQHIMSARDVFLGALVRQRLTRRRRLRLLDVEADLLRPVLALPVADATAVGEAFADRVAGMRVPRLLRLDDLVEWLWAAPSTVEPAGYEPELPGEVEGGDPQAYPPAVTIAAQRVLSAARQGPVRLSTLVAQAAEVPGADVDDRVADVVELVTLSTLWAFAPDPAGDDDGFSREVDALAAGLVAVHSGSFVDGPAVWGDDLVVSGGAS